MKLAHTTLLGVLLACACCVSSVVLVEQEYLCHPDTMGEIADMYLYTQPHGNWSGFFAHLADDVVVESNVLSRPNSVGKAASEAGLSTINVLFQALLGVTRAPRNYYSRNGVTAVFEKTQESLVLPVPHNISFYHTLLFDSDCKVKRISEFADSGKTGANFPTAFGDVIGLTCNRLLRVCEGHVPSWGAKGNCYDFWDGAPQFRRNRNLEIIQNARSYSCVNAKLDTLESGLASGVPVFSSPEFRTAICQGLGAPIVGVEDGCW